jgi:N-acetylglucosaminyl-diphospho-decaprenol L-rhamnosyltransferase
VLDDEKPTIVSALLRSPEHPASINARPRVTPAREFLKALRGSRAYALKGRGAPGELMKVDQVDGALLGLTAADFSALDGFDARFELYYEDVDLCARANERNGCVLVLTEWGTHIGGASFATSTRAFTMNRISRIRYLRKHMRGRLGAASVGLLVACTEWAARTLTRQSEGRASRARALRLQLRELASPGSVRLLDD